MWTQIAGKVRLALEPMVNQWWQVHLYVSARGLTTSLMHAGDVGVEMEFDFIAHRLEIRTSRGEHGRVALEARPVADFYTATMNALRQVGVRVSIWPRPVEVEESIPFPGDFQHTAYEPTAAHDFWTALVSADRLFKSFRSGFVGKAPSISSGVDSTLPSRDSPAGERRSIGVACPTAQTG